MDFDGKVGGDSRVGRPRGKAEESRADFLKRQQKERESRERKRVKEAAAKKLQTVYRGYRIRKLQRAEKRLIFDKRFSDISRVLPVLPGPQKAKFVFHALMPMLRLFAFFFKKDEDAARLSGMLELLLLSGAQPEGVNIFHLAVADDLESRRGFMAILERFLGALLRLERAEDAAKVLLALQATLFSGAPSYSPTHPQKSGEVVAQLLRRTQVLPLVGRAVLTSWARQTQGAELVLLLCAGIEAAADLQIQRGVLAELLSAPGLCDALCEARAQAPTATLAQQCLQKLCHLVLSTAGTLVGAGSGASALSRGSAVALLENLVSLLEKFVFQIQGASGAALTTWIGWLSWAKEQGGGADQHDASEVKQSVQMSRLYRAGFVRALLSSLDRSSSEGLLAVCRLYFAPADGGSGQGECDPPPEVLQTLAFATPLAERLFPTFEGLMKNRNLEAVFQSLGPPALASSEAIRLRVFCAVYALQLQPMYDYEFFGAANPLRIEQVQQLLPFLNRLAYVFVTSFPDQSVLMPAAKALRSSLTSLLSLLYHRHRRKAILKEADGWIISESRTLLRRAPVVVDLGADAPDEVEMVPADGEDGMEVDEEAAATRPQAGGASSSSAAGTSATASVSQAEKALQAVLAEIPHVLPFQDRVSVLQSAILADQEQRRDTRGPWGPSAQQKHQIRRNNLVEDGYTAFERLNDERELRDLFRVEFIDPDGQPESGVDGGGLFKEFMVHICRTMFDPEFGLFAATSEQTLLPAVSAFRSHKNAGELYTFLGKVVGKAIYEMFLLEPQFSPVFVNRLLARTNEVDDVAALDKELHRNMLQIKESSDVESLELTFSLSVAELGAHVEIDLIPNGRNVPVTKENLTRYFHLMANYRTNIQFQRHTAAFLSGLQKVVPLAWLKMFDPYELNLLISGSTTGFDVADLQANTVYSGGYQEDSPVVVWLWELIQHHMEPEDMGRFLMFATSCSRAPLLGFKNLYPKFCIHRVPDAQRLPTASTCANLLKLPDYTNFESLKKKVLQAIRAEAGFDLS